MPDTTTTWIIAAAVLAVVLLAVVGAMMWRNAPARRREKLRARFGPEYDLAVQQHGANQAHRMLEARERRVEKLPLRSLSSSECATFAQSWRHRQEQFVDTPSAAVSGAHELVQRVMLARGYPVEDFEQSVADLSVEYGALVNHYRAAHELEHTNRTGQINTEELRQAMVHYRALFDELLGSNAASEHSNAPSEPAPRSERARQEPRPEHRAHH